MQNISFTFTMKTGENRWFSSCHPSGATSRFKSIMQINETDNLQTRTHTNDSRNNLSHFFNWHYYQINTSLCEKAHLTLPTENWKTGQLLVYFVLFSHGIIQMNLRLAEAH